jgi:hypothetical protein
MPNGWATGWLVAYAALVAAVVALAVLRSGATLWRGGAFVTFNALFLVLAIGATVASARGSARALATASGMLLLTSWTLKSRWLVVGGDDVGVNAAIEECARRVCAECVRVNGGYNVPLSGGELRVQVRRVGARCTLLTFDVPPGQRKAQLLQRLLAKQYHGALPTLRIPIQ